MTTLTDRPTPAEPGVRPEPRLAWHARLAGLIAGLSGLAAAQLLTWFLATPGSPITSVGEWIISWLPAGMIDFGKNVLGLADKPVLIAIITVAVLIITALAGQLELRRRLAGLAVFAAVAAIGLIGVASLADSTPTSFLPTIVGLALGYAILRMLIARLRSVRTAAQPQQARARRDFLRLSIIVGAAAVVASVGARALSGAATAVSTARTKITLPKAAAAAPPVPAAADLHLDGLTPYISPNADFYRIDTALQPPQVDPAEWSLKITGLVANEISISFDELLAKPLVEHLTTLTCVSNEVGGNLAGNALWLGYPIRKLLAQAEPHSGADMVLSTSHDGWTAGTPLSALTDPDREALLAVGMNGEPLPVEHGFPVRMVVPGLYGYVSATKWVTELKVTTFAEDQGYWTPLGWSERGPIKTASRIDVPAKNTIKPGTTAVAGVAWDQHTGIKGVEVQVDDGPWQPAKLAATTGPDTWRQWVLEWDAPVGDHRLRVRATNALGEVQTEMQADPAPDGASGWHQIDVKVRA